MEDQLSMFELKEKKKKVVNVSTVPQRSPFRYPGGKTWLVPTIRKWLLQDNKPKHLYEPFLGGGIVSLTSAFEDLATHITMAELDSEIAAVWEVLINGDHTWLADRIFNFELTSENANRELQKKEKTIQDVAFNTILKNRIFHGGIITKGAGLIKNGEKGKGIHSRWYPKTLKDRMMAIGKIKGKISFYQGDAFEGIKERSGIKDMYHFIDPPYTKAGRRLYTHSEIDNDHLFQLTSDLKGKYMLTYDDSEEIRNLLDKYKLQFRTIPMKTTHHVQKNEIIISDNFNWW